MTLKRVLICLRCLMCIDSSNRISFCNKKRRKYLFMLHKEIEKRISTAITRYATTIDCVTHHERHRTCIDGSQRPSQWY